MKTAIIIPARYASTRFPGKPLQMLKGKTLIQRSWEKACEVKGDHEVYIATDDKRIADAAKEFGAEVIMTDEACANGTERCADALSKMEGKYDLILNLQGDAPLTPHWFLKDLIEAMIQRADIQVATPILRCDTETYKLLKEDRKNDRVGGTTAVFAQDKSALYFSKEVLPYVDKLDTAKPNPVFHHVGVYAYRPAALKMYTSWQEGPLEKLEGLEQLRFLENNEKVLCVEVDAKGQLFWELNNPVDVARIESVL